MNTHPTPQQVHNALKPIPDGIIFPALSQLETVLHAGPELENVYVKRPPIIFFDIFQQSNVVKLIPDTFLREVKVMEKLHKHSHPGIVQSYGCCVRRGHITGIVLDEFLHDLTNKEYVGQFMKCLASAVHHLHSLGFAHNDLNPSNMMINDQGMPATIDFGSCHKIGEKLAKSRVTMGWIDRR